MPGVLPVLNKKVVDFTLRMAIATHCEIARESRFARKNYFYPDLPKGYQIPPDPTGTFGGIFISLMPITFVANVASFRCRFDAGR